MSEPATGVSAVRTSLRAKLVRTMIATLAAVATAVLVTVVAVSYWSASDALALVEGRIRDDLTRKGRVLVKNQAIALRGLVADNAFGDVKQIVNDTTRGDPDVVYGAFVAATLDTWAYSFEGRPQDSAADAVKELRLDRVALSQSEARFGERELFDRKVFQFSAPVREEDGTRLGTIVYGISAAPLVRALADARADFHRSLLMAVVLLGAVTLGMTFFGVVLARKTAARITYPLVELTQTATAIAGGARGQRVSLRGSQDEIEALGSAFNQMVGELNDSYGRLEALNRTLERRVEERTRDLATVNANLRLVFETVNEGLVTISKDGVMAAERSAMIDRWFGPYQGRVLFADYMMAFDSDFAESFRLGHEALLEGFLPTELCLSQLPSRLRRESREFKCTYLPIAMEGEHRGLLVAIDDVTEQAQLAQQDAEQRELLAFFQAFTRDRAGFLAFFDEASHILRQVSADARDVIRQKRLIHTLKGNASCIGLTLLAQLCHDIEAEIEEHRQIPATGALATLRSRWLTLTQALTSFMGERGRDTVEIHARDLDALCAEVRNGATAPQVITRLTSWQHEPVERPLGRLAIHARALGERLGKGDVIVDVEADRVRLDPQRWSGFWSELVHVVRNAVDHGFETPAERRAAGKTPRPRLRLGVSVQENELVVEVEDDGGGIDWEAVKSRASKNGLPVASEEELIQALCMPGFTTRDEVSTISGRGLGLSAVHRRVQEFRGKMTVTSVRGSGACWRFSFPLPAPGVLAEAEVRPERARTAVA